MYEAAATPLNPVQNATSPALNATSPALNATSTDQNQSNENPEELPIHPVQKIFPKFNEYDESFQNLLLINLFPEVQKALNDTYAQELQQHITYIDSLS